jgi:prophage regulatory protein
MLRQAELEEAKKKAWAKAKAAAAKQRAIPIAGIKLIDPHALRVKGVVYHINHLRKLWERGEFPKPFNLSPRRIAWREEDIDAWIEGKIAAAARKAAAR